MFRTLLTVACALLFSAVAVRAQTVDEVIAKNIQAHGGMEKLKAVQTIRISGKFNQGSFRAGFLQENKRPDKVREEFVIQGLAQIQAYDGKTGWQISPFGGRKDPELMSQDDVKSLQIDADIDGPMVNYKEKGHKAELAGHDSVEGTDCYKVKLYAKKWRCASITFWTPTPSSKSKWRIKVIFAGRWYSRKLLWRLRTSERAVFSFCVWRADKREARSARNLRWTK